MKPFVSFFGPSIRRDNQWKDNIYCNRWDKRIFTWSLYGEMMWLMSGNPWATGIILYVQAHQPYFMLICSLGADTVWFALWKRELLFIKFGLNIHLITKHNYITQISSNFPGPVEKQHWLIHCNVSAHCEWSSEWIFKEYSYEMI